jgi:hypothetical protein
MGPGEWVQAGQRQGEVGQQAAPRTAPLAVRTREGAWHSRTPPPSAARRAFSMVHAVLVIAAPGLPGLLGWALWFSPSLRQTPSH